MKEDIPPPPGMEESPEAPKVHNYQLHPGADPLARALAQVVQDAYGSNQASTLDMSESLASPRGYVGTGNFAIDRAIGGKVPLGRIMEISGWPNSGKSTTLDQIFACCQRDGGIGVLADTERTRVRSYMEQIGVRPESLVWVAGSTVETMFEEVETIARKARHDNAVAWAEALKRAGIKVPKLATYNHDIFDPRKRRTPQSKPLHRFQFHEWGRDQAAALLAYQKREGLPQSAIRDDASRQALRPCIIFAETKEEEKEALEAWDAGDTHPLVQPADRPIIIGWDSVAGTATEAELQGDARSQHVAVAAKVIRKNLRRLVQLIDDEAIALVVVNQRYEKIPMGGMPMRGGTSETNGGGGIKYHTSNRLEVDMVRKLWANESAKNAGLPPIGQVNRVKVRKNKINDPHHQEEYALIYGRGAENAWTIYQDLKKRGIISVGGAWSKFTDPTILGGRSFRGWQELANLMAEDPELFATLQAIYFEGR